MRRSVLLLAGWLGFAACGAVLALGQLRQHWAQRESNPVARGRLLAGRLGCFGCHAPPGAPQVPNPGSATGTVPAFKSATLMMDVSGPEDIREYILHGYPRRKAGGAAWQQAQAAALKMPAYQGELDAEQLEDLLAYYLSANNRLDLPQPALAGRELASRLGCFGCHGVDGSGGVANPGSLKGYVPGWLGPDYHELVAGQAELREWILDGSIRRLREHLAARQFLTRQKVQMPPYRSLLDALVAYIEALRAGQAAH
jgi:hypothetical protein